MLIQQQGLDLALPALKKVPQDRRCEIAGKRFRAQRAQNRQGIGHQVESAELAGIVKQ